MRETKPSFKELISRYFIYVTRRPITCFKCGKKTPVMAFNQIMGWCDSCVEKFIKDEG